MTQSLRVWHRRNAIILGLFLTLHILTHLAAIFGPDTHDRWLSAIRPLYRHSVVEFIIIGLFIAQVGLGLALAWPRFRQRGKTLWSWVQLISGVYLAIFIVNHIFLGILRARRFEGIETDFFFAAATLVTAPFHYGFIPYYFLAITALFSHVSAALHWQGRSKGLCGSIVLIGILVAAPIVGAYGGLFYDIVLPEPYVRYMEETF